VPARTIERVDRVTDSGFAREAGSSGEQADFDKLPAHLLDSTAAATDWALGGNEGRLADTLVITREGEIRCIEVIGTPAAQSSPTGILIHGKGRGARIAVKDSSIPIARSDPG
jgi:hypothetical protein